MVPRRIKNLLFAGRLARADPTAFASARAACPTCMAIGRALRRRGSGARAGAADCDMQAIEREGRGGHAAGAGFARYSPRRRLCRIPTRSNLPVRRSLSLGGVAGRRDACSAEAAPHRPVGTVAVGAHFFAASGTRRGAGGPARRAVRLTVDRRPAPASHWRTTIIRVTLTSSKGPLIAAIESSAQLAYTGARPHQSAASRIVASHAPFAARVLSTLRVQRLTCRQVCKLYQFHRSGISYKLFFSFCFSVNCVACSFRARHAYARRLERVDAHPSL